LVISGDLGDLNQLGGYRQPTSIARPDDAPTVKSVVVLSIKGPQVMRKIVTIGLAITMVLALNVTVLASEHGKKEAEPWGGKTVQSYHHDAHYPSVGRNSLRVAGANRYDTAAAIAEISWSYEDTIVVFLANGENFPDALGMGPSTFELGPLLLTQRDRLPNETIRVLKELEPCMVVVVGGRGAVSDEVARQADRYTEDCF
jgi:hypothetical protein